ncbi:PEP-CTERM sorting domain-containing protein [Deinococcus aerius]|uniref:PEP-CTERM sorting domain-containing protein n=1 Tax=Deinococcus aerius TaxID=200253 RepID=A0A2I9DTV2_9DEIO|nr:hypothetical protein [Deinococcus aerius]GBF06097.1 PEP-CTERM sorting domain-containing protein [Deinococcus aerius]
MNRASRRGLLLLGLAALTALPASAQGDLLKQWASAVVTRSSEYGSSSWSAKQALGEPNTMTYGDRDTAWAPASRNGLEQSITVAFAKPVYATAVLVRQTFGNGFVRRIFAIDPGGTPHLVWSGKDTTQPGYTVNFIATFPKTSYLVRAVKVVIDPNHDPDAYEEIDAIALHGYPQ